MNSRATGQGISGGRKWTPISSAYILLPRDGRAPGGCRGLISSKGLFFWSKRWMSLERVKGKEIEKLNWSMTAERAQQKASHGVKS